MKPSAWRIRLYNAGWSQPDGSWSFSRYGPERLPGRRAAVARRLYAALSTSPAALLRRTLENLAWPPYDCEDCIGMRNHGCYCAAVGDMTPGGYPDESRRFWRTVHGFLYIKTSPFWDELERM